MPKHTKKAKNAKNTTIAVRHFFTKTQDQEYAQVIRMLGDCRVECNCFDNKTRLGIIRNKLRKGKANRVKVDDIVLISKRDFQDDKADIIHVYNAEDVKKLRQLNEIPDIEKEDADDIFQFMKEDKKPEVDYNEVFKLQVKNVSSSEENSSSDEDEDDDDSNEYLNNLKNKNSKKTVSFNDAEINIDDI